MHIRYVTIILALASSINIFPVTISSTPVCIVYTPNSILAHKEKYKALPVGNRTRYATCTSVAWFHGNYFAALNLYGQKLITYTFDPEQKTFSLLQEINNSHGTRFSYPEHLAVSPDGSLLAISNAYKTFPLNVYTIDEQTHLINPVPIISLPNRKMIHNARFSPDNNYLAYVTFDPKNAVCMHKIIRNSGSITLQRVYTKTNYAQTRIKGINFTQNNNYVVLAHALSIKVSKHVPYKSSLVVHTFNASDGTLGEVVCTMNGTFSTEDIAFLSNDVAIVLSDQGHDTLIVYPFDPETGQIDPNYTLIQNPEAQLSFPHGLSVSADGNYLAVSNYGDDKFNLYQIEY